MKHMSTTVVWMYNNCRWSIL